MAPISPGSAFSARKKIQKPTATTKLHRFESFTRRISKLKIDPIHRVDRTSAVYQDASLSISHFRASLEDWTELNLSLTFTTFLKQVKPLSESLPQLLYHADEISRILLENLEKRDPLALEPLLNLVSHFAHDLGQKFEKYFPNLVTLVADVAASSDNPEVIEWCYTCLAWIFKFLSRLLVPDLRPVLGLMLSYLSSPKLYISRFTAEALAFLLRKAALFYPRNEDPLSNAISYLLKNSRETNASQTSDWQFGLMTLFSEVAIGTEGIPHTSGPHLISCILKVLTTHSPFDQSGFEVLQGVLIRQIHQTNYEGFAPILKLILDFGSSIDSESKDFQASMAQRLLFIATSTRKGSRIRVWNDVVQVLEHIHRKSCPNDNLPHRTCLVLIAMVLQYAPMDQILPHVAPLLQISRETTKSCEFWGFCDIFAKIGHDRFRTLLLPIFQRHFVSNWQDDEASTFLSLYNLGSGASSSVALDSNDLTELPQHLENHIFERVGNLSNEQASLEPLVDAYAWMIESFEFSKSPTHLQSLETLLHQRILSEFQDSSSSVENVARRFLAGRGLKAYLKLAIRDGHSDPIFWKLFTKLSPEYFRFQSFLTAITTYADDISPVGLVGANEVERVQNYLIENLLSDSTQLKECSLKLIRQISTQLYPSMVDVAEAALGLLNTTYNPSNARQIAMLLRRLPVLHRGVLSASRTFIPSFCLGLLGTYHDQTRQVLCSVIAEIAGDSPDEQFILDTSIRWMQMPGKRSPAAKDAGAVDIRPSAFQCSNMMSVERVSGQTFQKHEIPLQSLHEFFDQENQVLPISSPPEGRRLSLDLLLSMPEIAEKYSRFLVPVFLLAQAKRKGDPYVVDSNDSTSSRTLSPGINEDDWTFTDRKAFLELFSKFKNPRALYRSHEVRKALFDLLGNGNSEVQRLALKAIFTWKDPSLKDYHDRFSQILDKCDSTEINLLLGSDSQESAIDPSHRQDALGVLLRILYGQMIGHSRSQGTQESKRKSILRLVLRLQPSEVEQFLDISLGNFAEMYINDDRPAGAKPFGNDSIPLDQQYGILRMLWSFMEISESELTLYGEHILEPVLYCTVHACHQLHHSNAETDTSGRVSGMSMVRNIRKVGLQCLDMLFKNCENISWDQHLKVIFSEIISPRLPAFAVENGQGISWILRIFSTWSNSQSMVRFLLDYDDVLLDMVWESLSHPDSKHDVKLFILEEIVMPIAELALGTDASPNHAARVLQGKATNLLRALAIILGSGPPKDVLHSATSILPMLISFASSPIDAEVLLTTLVAIQKESRYKLPPKIRGKLLQSVESLLMTFENNFENHLYAKIYGDISPLFNYFKDLPNRKTLCSIVHLLSSDLNLGNAWTICEAFNTPSSVRLDEIDYDSAIGAFASIDELDLASNPHQWPPILYNLLYLSREAEDFSVRSHAVHCQRNFIKRTCEARMALLEDLIRNILIPAYKKGVNEGSEIVRADYVSLFGLVVQHMEDAPELQDLKSLLVQNDDEASFFSNVLHIQQHRRLRAQRRLTSEVENGNITANNISTFFLPLLERFAIDVNEDSNAQTLKGQSIISIGTLLQWVQWKQFKATFRQYKAALDSKPGMEKDSIKLVGVAADALTRAHEENRQVSGAEYSRKSHLALSLPDQQTVSRELRLQFIPKLATFVHLKDETQISLRIPAAVTAVKLIKILPAEEMTEFISPVLLDISQILRSRTQEARDIARNTIADIVALLGPTSVHFVLKELRSALTRGYQLHVLSYTLHSILLVLVPRIEPGQLDYCLHDFTAVIMDDIFGTVGREKDNQEYISSMREVKSKKSFDSMELLAKFVGLRQLSKLTLPLQVLLTGGLDAKDVRHADELIRRIGVGLSRNEAAHSRDLLTFSYELIQELYKDKAHPAERPMTSDELNRQRYLLQVPAVAKSAGRPRSPLLYKLIRFAIDLVRSTLLKHVNLLTPQNIHGFLPILGDALIEGQEDVKISAMRLLSVVLKLPLDEIEQNATLYVLEAIKMIKNSTKANDEASQAALKLITAVIRDRENVAIRDSDLGYLLHRILPDLEEPDQQGVTFNFIKAVMAKKVVVPEIYELVDKIGIMMVTNHSASARVVARGVYVHFLLEYPQTKNRWTKQLKFLLKNLEYKHPEGRQSVLEAVNTLLSKSSNDVAEEIISMFLFPVVLQISNDENERCQEMSAALLGQFFKKSNPTELVVFLATLRAWIEQEENPALIKFGMLAFGILMDASLPQARKEIPHLRASIEKILQQQTESEEADWELLFTALKLFTKISSNQAEDLMSGSHGSLWSAVSHLQSHSHPWVQATVASLTKVRFQDLAKTNASSGLAKLPLTGQWGLEMSAATMLHLLKSMIRIVKHNQENPELRGQIVENLMFMGRCLCVNGLKIEVQNHSSKDRALNDNDMESDVESIEDDNEGVVDTKQILAIHYLLHQCASVLRQEPSKVTIGTLLPKQSTLQLLIRLIPHIHTSTLNPCLHQLLLPLHHLADPNVIPPKSADPTFAATYEALIASVHEAMETIRKHIGDSEYVNAMTTVSRAVRQRREERRTKRRIERVAEPERAAREKRRKAEKKKDRKKELAVSFKRGRKGAG